MNIKENSFINGDLNIATIIKIQKVYCNLALQMKEIAENCSGIIVLDYQPMAVCGNSHPW